LKENPKKLVGEKNPESSSTDLHRKVKRRRIVQSFWVSGRMVLWPSKIDSCKGILKAKYEETKFPIGRYFVVCLFGKGKKIWLKTKNFFLSFIGNLLYLFLDEVS
jgi:hypothetical protein